MLSIYPGFISIIDGTCWGKKWISICVFLLKSLCQICCITVLPRKLFPEKAFFWGSWTLLCSTWRVDFGQNLRQSTRQRTKLFCVGTLDLCVLIKIFRKAFKTSSRLCKMIFAHSTPTTLECNQIHFHHILNKVWGFFNIGGKIFQTGWKTIVVFWEMFSSRPFVGLTWSWSSWPIIVRRLQEKNRKFQTVTFHFFLDPSLIHWHVLMNELLSVWNNKFPLCPSQNVTQPLFSWSKISVIICKITCSLCRWRMQMQRGEWVGTKWCNCCCQLSMQHLTGQWSHNGKETLHRDKQTNIQTERKQTNRQTGKQTNRQTISKISSQASKLH